MNVRVFYGDRLLRGKADNALLRFVNCKNLLLKGIRICQSHWYGIYCADCCNVTLADMCYYAPGIFPDLDGAYMRGTATGMISDKKKFVGRIMDLTGLETAAMHIKNVCGSGCKLVINGKKMEIVNAVKL